MQLMVKWGNFCVIAWKLFHSLLDKNIFNIPSSYLSEILDVFDGPFGIIEQSIVGNVKDTYKKVKHLINWVETNMKHRGPYDRDNKWSSHG